MATPCGCITCRVGEGEIVAVQSPLPEGGKRQALEHGERTVELKYGLISVDDHVQEHPEVWTQRMSRAKWGERIPHIVQQPDGTEYSMVDGRRPQQTSIAWCTPQCSIHDLRIYAALVT